MDTVPADKTMSLPSDLIRSSVAVLVSGGIHGAVLLAQALDHFKAVYPIYSRFGLPWEEAEEQYLKRFLAAMRGPRLARLKILDLPLSDIYAEDGTISAQLVSESPELYESLRISSRSVLLVTKAAVWSAVNGIEALATGPVGERGKAHSTTTFFDQLELVVQSGLGQSIRIIQPLSVLRDEQVLMLGRDLPFEFTFSCICPVYEGELGALHCGTCHKCQDRQEAFLRAGLTDRTRYAQKETALVALS